MYRLQKPRPQICVVSKVTVGQDWLPSNVTKVP
jgi:hypothetical protein